MLTFQIESAHITARIGHIARVKKYFHYLFSSVMMKAATGQICK